MESLAVFVDEEWDNLSRMFTSSEEDHYSIDQLHGHGLFPINVVETQSTFWSNHDESSNASGPVFDPEGSFFNYSLSNSQENSNSSGSSDTNTNLSLPTPTPTYENYYHHTAMPNNNYNYSDQSSMDFHGMDDKSHNFLGQVFSDDVMEEILCLKQASAGKMENDSFDGQQQMADHHPGSRGMHMPLKRKLEMPELPQAPKDEVVQTDLVDKNPKKKQRVSRENNKNKKSAQSKKNQKVVTDGNDGEETNTNNGGGNGPSSTSYCSEDDSNSNSNGSQESNGDGALNLNGKTRASRGAATDPQSLYARKRRERINERLRILQNLVPNGTKVDISTMLEEAVHYVKFLQLQIKLLSSDEMWMYAPIAYNGMDMGLYQRISNSAQ